MMARGQKLKRARKRVKRKAPVRKRKYQRLEIAAKQEFPKKQVHVTVRRKVLDRAPEEYAFVLDDGRRLHSLFELIDELETMNEETFRRFVNHSKNDFAAWVSDVFEADDVAEEIRGFDERVATQRALMKAIIRELRWLLPEEEQELVI